MPRPLWAGVGGVVRSWGRGVEAAGALRIRSVDVSPAQGRGACGYTGTGLRG